MRNLTVEYSNTKREQNFSLYNLIKATFDTLAAVFGLVIALPIMFITAIAIKIDSSGPILYSQERVGVDGKVFKVYKLRSMRTDAEKQGAQWAQKNDPRVTRVGAFIRKTRIDELPQLFNVLKGEMSLVGPRPERPMFTEQFDQEIPGFKKRLLVKPGLTGLAQVNGGYEIQPKEKLEYDLQYIEKQCLLLDLKILLKTVRVVFTGEGAR